MAVLLLLIFSLGVFVMSELSMALNSKVDPLTSGTAVQVNGEMDLCFIITNCTAFKLQGSMDGGSTYQDIAGSSSLLGAAGTLTLSTPYVLSLTRCRQGWLKAVFSGTNPVVNLMRRYMKQQPLPGLVRTVQTTIVDPVAGTA